MNHEQPDSGIPDDSFRWETALALITGSRHSWFPFNCARWPCTLWRCRTHLWYCPSGHFQQSPPRPPSYTDTGLHISILVIALRRNVGVPADLIVTPACALPKFFIVLQRRLHCIATHARLVLVISHPSRSSRPWLMSTPNHLPPPIWRRVRFTTLPIFARNRITSLPVASTTDVSWLAVSDNFDRFIDGNSLSRTARAGPRFDDRALPPATPPLSWK